MFVLLRWFLICTSCSRWGSIGVGAFSAGGGGGGWVCLVR